ncbi:glycoside hydrolase family 16 protein [Schizophyllum amplum]|uniref:Glycoside hydrolase family 16 protein n=1 Tax=Schizophyllum amplum TaxID=97359 RepID=A0A550CNF0_9AGAR|nr:glycoside hydrolase family 16 protein [Auriculariopsis ampla]
MLYDLPPRLLVLFALCSRLSRAFQPLQLPHDLRSVRNYTNAGPIPPRQQTNAIERRLDAQQLDVNANGSTFLWLLEDDFSGDSFFDSFGFFTGKDPTNYVDSDTAFGSGLAYVQEDDIVVMKGDNTSWLADGEYRSSVRISSYKQYNTGLFILDLNKAPWGCAVWPAFWTLGSGTWPYTGEIDIIEGVHDNEHNQIAWHTGSGCYLNPNATFSGTVITSDGTNNTNCDGTLNSNAGCAIGEWSRASYGPYFDAQGGGVFAMKWDENGIAISPNPSTWGTPVAMLSPDSCDPISYFTNHSIIFDITFCGDWAGNSYATSGDPANFVNASWSINSLKVYSKQPINGHLNGAAPGLPMDRSHFVLAALALLMLPLHWL